MGRHIKHGQEPFRAPKPIPFDSIVSYRPYSPSDSCRYVQISPVSDFFLEKTTMQLTMKQEFEIFTPFAVTSIQR